jgi:hypothetical protein
MTQIPFFQNSVILLDFETLFFRKSQILKVS